MTKNLSLSERWNAPTSRFFKPLVMIGTYMAALAAAIVVFQQQLVTAGLPVPEVVLVVAEIVGWVSAAIAAVSKLTVDWDEYAKRKALADIGPDRSQVLKHSNPPPAPPRRPKEKLQGPTPKSEWPSVSDSPRDSYESATPPSSWPDPIEVQTLVVEAPSPDFGGGDFGGSGSGGSYDSESTSSVSISND